MSKQIGCWRESGHVSRTFMAGAILFLIDRVTKYAAVRLCVERVLVNQYLAFELVLNRGVSWSMLHSSSAFYFGILTLFIISLTLFIAWDALQQARANQPITGHILVLVGSISNIIDRFMYGGVVDFVECSYGSWCWPTFNFADLYIVLGIIYLLWSSVRPECIAKPGVAAGENGQSERIEGENVSKKTDFSQKK